MTIPRPARWTLALIALALFALPCAAFAETRIPIIVDGIPLDARAVSIKDDIYIPAWILENYAHTKVRWMRQANILEIVTREAEPGPESGPPKDGRLNMRIGFYLESEGFIVGKNTRLFLLNVDPKDFRFPDGKTAADRAHEGAVDRIGTASDAMKEYLTLSPTDRFSSKGWKIVARMPKEEIVALSASVDKYEMLYRSLFYDLLTNLVIDKEQAVNASSVIDEALKGTRIDRMPVGDDGSASIKVPNGIYFLYGRMLYGNRQVVWDMPVTVRGGDTTVELSNRNAALLQ